MTLEAPEVEIVKKSRIYCDGSDDVLGHPRVWLQIPEEIGFVECPYCDKRFELQR
ncbi:MAG: zinc-finger domain-containing protein [Rhodobacteraceae bacterium]|jgi:uncharacterized Zn-finger protein|nr:zinc-finger domain-containing protein [Paracoccaceae bacterium]MBV03706.1 zinc-finger domain-containing protein [Paracoccaceae bacterium]MDG1880169.1 zinc-finger domain-containing protein [Paracoccaceae bacterium]MDG1939812.1 zinc-finger domain-containing protein [Paracoccaceae bacterium]|tara:strand:- start:3548 stop:3712 length:165 start_codon:yes stop_codon:yes gene_type:complete